MTSYQILALGAFGVWVETVSARSVRQACVAARSIAPTGTEVLTVNGVEIPR